MDIKCKLKRLMKSDNRIVRKLSWRLYSIFKNSRHAVRYRPRMDDKKYIVWLYKRRFGVEPDLESPKSFNEKNNWRKLNDRQDRYIDMVDKYMLKSVVKQKCGSGYTIPTLGVWDDPDEIDFSMLPEKYVLKPNHAGGVIVCRDNETFDRETAIEELKQALKLDYFHMSREWPYKNVRRRILCEQYMGENLIDYKNYCFNGRHCYTLVWKNKSREDGRKPQAFFCGMYDKNWEKTDMQLDYQSLQDEVTERPACYDEMVAVCEKMSAQIPFVRVDCFIIGGHVYVGEMTFFPWGGFQKFKDEKWNLKLGEMEKLPGMDE